MGIMCDARIFISALLVISFLSTQASGSSLSDDNSTCTLTTHNTSVLAYVDWPFRIDCEYLESIWKARNPNSDEDLECRLQRNGILQTDNIFTIINFDDDSTFAAHLYVNGTRCVTGNVQVILLPFPNETCLTALNDPTRMKNRAIVMRDHVQLDCGISNVEYPEVIPRGANKGDFKTVWITNDCTDYNYRRNNLWANVEGPKGFGETLDMPTADFYDAVNFTCAVSYKGKTLYPVSYQMCMRQRTVEQTPSLTCVKSYNVVKSGYVSFDCSGQMTGGLTKPGDFKMQWKKGEKVLCENNIFENTALGIDDRFSCIADDETDNEPFRCIYNKDIPSSEIQLKRKHIKLSFEIKDVQSDDFGAYTAVFMAAHNGMLTQELSTITVTEDRTPYYEMLVRVFSAVFRILAGR